MGSFFICEGDWMQKNPYKIKRPGVNRATQHTHTHTGGKLILAAPCDHFQILTVCDSLVKYVAKIFPNNFSA